MENKKNNEKFFNESLRVIYNEDFFTGLGENLLTIARRYNRKTSLLYIFIENFKEIIKSSGESIAEDLLRSFCHKLRYTLRESDFLARLSPESVVVLVSETDSFGTMMLIRRIENAFIYADFSFFRLNIVRVTAPEEGKSIPELIGKAEEKIERKRYSLATDDEIEKLDFWETTNFLIDKKLQVFPEAHFPYPFQDMTIQQNFSSSFIDHVQQYILQQIMTNKEKKGLLFLGIQRFKKPELNLQNYHVLKNIGTVIYLIGLKGEQPCSIPYVIPVYLPDEKICSYRFILFLSDKYAYALMGKEENINQFSGFHSSDFYFVEKIISKLLKFYFY